MREMKKTEAYTAMAKTSGLSRSSAISNASAVFQKVWRCKQALKASDLERNQELEFIGMIMSRAETLRYMDMSVVLAGIANKRRDLRVSHESELENTFVELKQQIC